MISTDENITQTEILCYHCGDPCRDDHVRLNDKIFCCNGCKTVYELLEDNNLCNYYNIDKTPGISKRNSVIRNYDFLDDHDLKEKLIDFSDGKRTKVTFNIPQMHCSSCIWILENLYRLDEGIIHSEVNFLQKKIFISYSEEHTSLKKVVELLDNLGYEPALNLENETSPNNKTDKSLYYKVGIAGFAFGNIMLLSFPQYLSISVSDQDELKQIFAYISIVLVMPVFFYCASDYFISAYKGLRNKIVNIDVPISLGIAVLFIRSIIEIAFKIGPGYLDSLSGLVFFLLLGKLFQNKTYEALNFERNYKSYFPIAVTIRKNDKETTVPASKISVNDRLIIRNNELIPADSVLIKGHANIDYGFVTGESLPVEKQNGEIIYAGGRQTGTTIEVEVIKEISQSYLTQLWNHSAFSKKESSLVTTIANSVSKYFTFGVLAIALGATAYWFPVSHTIAFNVFTAVLIVACPCALALSTPFTMGNTLRIFGRNNFYLKNVSVIEKIAKIKNIVFDKTGTLTEPGKSVIEYKGKDLSDYEKSLVRSAVRNSTHPLSTAIFNFLPGGFFNAADDYKENIGEGISATIEGQKVKLGSEKHVSPESVFENNFGNSQETIVHLSINDIKKGEFIFRNFYRDGLKDIIDNLKQGHELSLLSGDNPGEEQNLEKFFDSGAKMLFRQSPFDKLNYIKELQKENKTVLMIGDGLNDAGALKQSDVGISISENVNNFSPASDGLLDASSFGKLDEFMKFSKTSVKIIIASFVLSFLYNTAGLTFAVEGKLSPLIAAILMPLSSISVVVFTTLTTNFLAKKRGLL